MPVGGYKPYLWQTLLQTFNPHIVGDVSKFPRHQLQAIATYLQVPI